MELVGLCYSVVEWLDKKASEGYFKYSRVKCENLTWTWNEWALKIFQNFEIYFWVPLDRELAKKKFSKEAKLVNLTGIYKDCVGSFRKFSDFQLRPNFLIALTVAPKLFTPKNAQTSLKNAITHLQAPLGIKTLNNSYFNSLNFI